MSNLNKIRSVGRIAGMNENVVLSAEKARTMFDNIANDATQYHGVRFQAHLLREAYAEIATRSKEISGMLECMKDTMEYAGTLEPPGLKHEVEAPAEP